MGKIKNALFGALLFASVSSGANGVANNVPKPVPTASFERYDGVCDDNGNL